MSFLKALPLVMLVTSCAGMTRSDRVTPKPPSEYRIGSEDVLEVVIWHEPELSRLMPVRPDGFIEVPLAGEIEAAGKTPAELRTVLTKALELYIRDAAVTVLVREINGARYSVLGEVTRAGTFPLRGRISITQALAAAGGVTEFAGSEVLWTRKDGEGKPEKVKLSLEEVMKGEVEGSLWLAAGDVIYVP